MSEPPANVYRKGGFAPFVRYARAGIHGAGAQAISSATNLVLIVWLTRALTKQEFGQYSIAFAVALIAAGLVGESIALQMVVTFPQKDSDETTLHVGAHFTAILVIGTGAILLASAAALLPDDGLPVLATANKLALPLTTVAVSYAARDLLVRVAYSVRREALAIGSAAVGAIAAGLGIVAYRAVEHASPAIGLYIYAASQGSGVLFLATSLRVMPRATIQRLKCVFRRATSHGGWAAAASLAYSVRSYTHSLIGSPILGVEGIAEINATRVLVTPSIMAIPPTAQVLLPRLAEARRYGVFRVVRRGGAIAAALALAAALFGAVLILLQPYIVPVVLGNTYAGLGAVVAAWVAYSIALAVRNGLSITVQATAAFRSLFISNVVAALIALGLLVPFSYKWGTAGAVWSLALAELALAVMLWVVCRRLVMRDSQEFHDAKESA